LRQKCNSGDTLASSEYLNLSHVEPVVLLDDTDVVG
jgi:hypothetical protein